MTSKIISCASLHSHYRRKRPSFAEISLNRLLACMYKSILYKKFVLFTLATMNRKWRCLNKIDVKVTKPQNKHRQGRTRKCPITVLLENKIIMLLCSFKVIVFKIYGRKSVHLFLLIMSSWYQSSPILIHTWSLLCWDVIPPGMKLFSPGVILIVYRIVYFCKGLVGYKSMIAACKKNKI